MLDLTKVPLIDLGSVECINFILLHSKCRAVESDDSGPQFAIARESGQSLSSEVIVSIVCETPMGILDIAMDVALIDALSDRLIPGWRRAEAASLPFEWRAIATLEKYTLQTPFSEMQCRILNVRRYEHPQNGGGMLFGQALMDGQSYCVGLAIRHGVLSELEKYLGFPTAAPHHGLDGFTVQLQAKMQGPSLSCVDIQKLEPGDIILLPFCHDGNLRIALQIGARHTWTGVYDFDGNFSMISRGTQQ